ncbi:hypothetical protein J6590_048525 [Homalodisca vitripennis]|nr:hypothetical protein J6590_048525 [Homalodisca vitripennis]
MYCGMQFALVELIEDQAVPTIGNLNLTETGLQSTIAVTAWTIPINDVVFI